MYGICYFLQIIYKSSQPVKERENVRELEEKRKRQKSIKRRQGVESHSSGSLQNPPSFERHGSQFGTVNPIKSLTNTTGEGREDR